MVVRVLTGRLAPTPSGELHLGNTLAFGAAWLSARSAGGRLVLRIEDVDRGRARSPIAEGQRRDLRWLGLEWDEEVRPQRERDYLPWLRQIAHRTYGCRCTRRALEERTCPCPTLDLPLENHTVRFRLNPGVLRFVDRKHGAIEVDPTAFGDPVLRRRDGVFSYNLAVVADDIADGVTEVVRGADLLPYTSVQIQLWEALGAAPPTWLHAPLVLGPDGKKLSKSHRATEIRALRDGGWTPEAVWRAVLPWLGIDGTGDLREAILRFDPSAGPRGPVTSPRLQIPR